MTNRPATAIFETLIMLSARDADAAADSLGCAIARRDDAQQRLQMLQQLRADYAQRLQNHVYDGLSFAAYRNFQRFLEKIDEAIAGQSAIEAHACAQAEQAQQHWQARKREGRTWSLLVERAADAELQREARLERKATDEFAARAALRRADAETW